MQDLRRYRVYAGGKRGRGRKRNMKGQSSKAGKKGTDGNHSCDKSEIRFDKDEGIELAVKNEKLDTKKSMNASDQGLDTNTCKNDEHSDQHICNMKDNKGSDGVVQDDSKNNLLKSNFDENREIETDDDSGSDVHIPVKRSCARNCIESDSDTDTSPGCDLFDRSVLPERNMPLNVCDRPKDMPRNEPVDNVCESVLENDDMMKNDISYVSDEEDAVFDNDLKNRSFDTVKDGTDNDTDMSFNDHAHSRNPLESSSDSNIKDEDIEKAIDANMYTCTDETETEVEFVADLGLRDRPDKDFKFVPLQNNDKQNICSKLNIRYIGKGCDSRLDRNSCIGVPLQSKEITGDGNCFFRAISYVISGTERNHAILRNATVKHLLQTKDMFSNTLRQEYRTVREYVLKRRIKEDGTWATDTEISALANLINTDIYSYNDQVPCWQLFSAKKPGRINIVTSDKGIYILYTGNVHFNVVESVDFVNFNSLEQTRTTKEDRTSKRTLLCPSIQADVKVKHVFKKCRSKCQIEEEIDEVVDKSPETFQYHVDPKGNKRRLTLETGTINHDERKGTANLFDMTYEQCASNQSESVVHNERNTKDETLKSDHKDKCTRVDTQITLVAQGTFNQGDTRFGDLSGKQCVTNSLSALLYSKVKNANDWKSTDLDRILNNGNELYCYIRRSTSLDNQYLLISDLYEYLDAYNELFNIVCREPVTGLLDGDELILAQSLSMTLKQALEKELCTDSDACFVTFARSTFIVLSGQDGFFIFDSHSRSSRGFLICNGHSVVLRTQSWQGVYKHCMR
ncbi:uncharacterized protein LOC105443054 isoform X3 [Strongylocentrotus purpuratus]|uniref:OTU domain-containing protein n=1 Tax=Strongylocentrotus purpuratus TaxID=7668 RepID=A0A7M7P7L6_STRPU|nr:uncharacterized protein LOC105443054 isoform X2 [Strongylocentrotus purpuratus]XP_030847548.1 uncharacterized protein LOC105443054 isoform X3 [Strongylocentrotus purpuratus]